MGITLMRALITLMRARITLIRVLGKRIVTMRYFDIAAVEHEGKDDGDKKMLSTSIIDEDYRNERMKGENCVIADHKYDDEDDLDEDNKEYVGDKEKLCNC